MPFLKSVSACSSCEILLLSVLYRFVWFARYLCTVFPVPAVYRQLNWHGSIAENIAAGIITKRFQQPGIENGLHSDKYSFDSPNAANN